MRIFRSWDEAGENKTRSRWRKLGRAVCGDPVGIVVVETGKVKGKDTFRVVLEDLGQDTYLVAANYYDVWSPSQTVPCASKSSIPFVSEKSSSDGAQDIPTDVGADLLAESAGLTGNDPEDDPSLSSPLPSPPLSFDRRISGRKAVKGRPQKDLGRKNGREFSVRHLEPAKGKNASHSAYFPSGFSDEDYMKVGALVEPVALVFDQLFKFRHYGEYDRDDYVPLNYDWCDGLIYRFRETIRLLVGTGILERTDVVTDKWGLGVELPRGKGTGRSYGYRLANPECRKDYHKVVLTDKRVCRKLDEHETVRYPVQRWLRSNLERLEVVMPEDEWLLKLAEGNSRRVNIYRSKLELIRDRNWLFKPDGFSRRISSNLTVLKRETRSCLRVDGDVLGEIDIKCSQWLFLALTCVKRKVEDAERFLRVCENDLYRHLADTGGWSRDRVKDTLTKRCLFASNDHRCQRTRIKRAFDREFPTIADFVRKQKSGRITKGNPKPWNKLARMLQREECNFVVFTVCERIRKERPGVFVGTIHDSLLCRTQDIGYVQGVLVEEFAKRGTTPRLEPRERL